MISQSTSVSSAILTVLGILIILIFGGSIYAFFLAIFQFIFSKGEADKIKKAWNNIRYMILGIILVIFLLFIFPILFQKLKVPGYKNYTAKKIFEQSSYILKNIIDSGKKSGLDGNKYIPPTQESASENNYEL